MYLVGGIREGFFGGVGIEVGFVGGSIEYVVIGGRLFCKGKNGWVGERVYNEWGGIVSVFVWVDIRVCGIK